MSRRAAFLDRDGTIIVDTGFVADPADVQLLPGATDALRGLAADGWALVIISNQSGIARGLITRDQAAAVHDRVVALLAKDDVALDGSYYCFHAPDERCGCRKPSPSMILKAADDLRLDVASSVMVGDRESDASAGTAAGCVRSIRIDLEGGWDGVETAIRDLR